VETFNQVDDHSRLCVGSTAARTFTAGAVTAAVTKAARRYGFPAIYLTDNAAVFTGKPRRGGMVSLERLLAAHRVRLRHSTPYHPQTCGKVERFHQTQKKWLTRQPQARSIAELQTQLHHFRRYYNTIRPHRALDRRTPAQAYTARPKATPNAAAFSAPPHTRVRHDKIDTSGVITLTACNRPHSQHLSGHSHVVCTWTELAAVPAMLGAGAFLVNVRVRPPTPRTRVVPSRCTVAGAPAISGFIAARVASSASWSGKHPIAATAT